MYSRILAAVVVAISIIAVVSADLCSKGRVEVQGNWYCQPVDAITYSNVGTPGTYDDIVDMAPDGICSWAPKPFSGPIAPLDEEISFHFRGPIHLKQFAAYSPLASHTNNRETSPALLRRHAHQHENFHKRSRLHNDSKRQEVTATINGQVVPWGDTWSGQTLTPVPTTAQSAVWVTAIIDGGIVSWINDWFGETAPATVATPSPQMVTATVNGNVVSWLNNWFGETATGSSATAVQMVTTTIDGQALSWPNDWFGGAATPTLAPTPESVSVGETSKVESAGTVLPTTNTNSDEPFPSPSATTTVIDNFTIFERIGYYNSASQTLDNLVFLGNYGGQGSGVFDFNYGASLSYVNSDGTGGSSSPQILGDVAVPSQHEFAIMLAQECGDDGTCGYVRPGAVAYHGFAGADKAFFFEFEMPMDGLAGYEGDMPAVWALNAKIPRTDQYGDGACSCWESGCGEFDIAEALNDGSAFLKSTLHDNAPGGDSDYIVRPEADNIKMAVIFSSVSSTIHVQVLHDSIDFSSSITAGEIEDLCVSGTGTSLFTITS